MEEKKLKINIPEGYEIDRDININTLRDRY